MRVAVISDPHGNLRALDAVLADLDATGGFDEIIMAGDFASGGPYPAECVERIRERGYRAVRGNTDEFIVEAGTAGAVKAQPIDPSVRHTGELLANDQWTAKRLSHEQIEYLAQLPLTVNVSGAGVPVLTICHATPWSAHDTVMPDAPEERARRMLETAGGQAVGYGHIHVQYERQVDEKLLVAVGSMGLPFDGDNRAAYTIFTGDTSGWTPEFRRVAYDVDEAARDAMSQNAPGAEGYVRRLRAASNIHVW